MNWSSFLPRVWSVTSVHTGGWADGSPGRVPRPSSTARTGKFGLGWAGAAGLAWMVASAAASGGVPDTSYAAVTVPGVTADCANGKIRTPSALPVPAVTLASASHPDGGVVRLVAADPEQATVNPYPATEAFPSAVIAPAPDGD